MLSNNWFFKILIKYFKKIIKWYNIAKSTRCYLIYIYICVCVCVREREREREREIQQSEILKIKLTGTHQKLEH